MARFGLDSDTESDASGHSSERQQRVRGSKGGSDADDDILSTESRSNDGDDSHSEAGQEAPPRHSLYDDDDDDDMSDEERGSHDEADDDRSFRSQSTRSHSMRLDSQSPRPRRRLLPSAQPAADSNRKHAPATTRWSNQPASTFRPGRTAVMQASLFGPSPADEDYLRDRHDYDSEGEAHETQSRHPQPSRSFFSQPPQPSRNDEKVLATGEEERVADDAGEQPQPAQPEFRPLRPAALVPLAESVANNREGSLVVASLALGRSYRVGFGPQGQVLSLRGTYRSDAPLQAGLVHVDRLQLTSTSDSARNDAIRLLELQLAKTDIYPPAAPDLPSSSAPQAVPSEQLRFHDFANLFSDEDRGKDSRTAGYEDEARLFRLGVCLFDEIADLALDEVDPASHGYVEAIRRRRLVSSWFEEAVSAAVEGDVSNLPAPAASSPSASARRIFALLSGHQLESACDAALESSNLRLATLLAQLGPDALAMDDQVRADVSDQLAKWREYRVDTFIDDAYRRVLELVSGNLGVSQGREDLDPKGDSVNELHVLESLGWKRAVAMGMWYGTPRSISLAASGADAGLAEVVERYEEAYRADKRVAAPAPAYLNTPSATSASISSLPWPPAPASATPLDPAFHLLKLFTSPTHALESALEPRNFGPSPLDYRLPWHLYLLLSRVLRRRDWEDRLEVEDGVEDGFDEDDAMRGQDGAKREASVERTGNSVTADRVTEAYAAQLEAQGEWHWSAFVLLHLELEDCRIKAIRELLARHVDELDQPEDSETDGLQPRNEKLRFLIDTLKIPEVWIYSAQADRALSSPATLFRAYMLLLAAQRATEAHAIAVEDLVPEALVRNDLSLVRRLLEPFLLDPPAGADESAPQLEGDVSGWNEGGRTYLLFLTQPDRPDFLSQTVQAVQALSKRVRDSNKLKSKRLLRLAVAEMESRLTVLAKANPTSSALERTQPSLLAASDRAIWIQGANKAFWQAAIGAPTAAA